MSLQQSEVDASASELSVEQEQAVLSKNPRPAHPRPSMTFLQQAQLLEWIHGRFEPNVEGKFPHPVTGEAAFVLVWHPADQAELDDLWMTAQRLRRMAGHEDEIRRVVTGR